jgi:hypothetical protein
MPAPGAGGVQTSLVGTVQGMMASARNAFRRKPGAPVQSPGDKNNPPDLSQFADNFEPSGGLFAAPSCVLIRGELAIRAHLRAAHLYSVADSPFQKKPRFSAILAATPGEARLATPVEF